MTSFIGQLRQTVDQKNDETFASWYDNQGRETNSYTYNQLWAEAGLIAYFLREEWGVEKGERVILSYDFGLHFFAAFIGCLRAGVVAVLTYPPFPPLGKSLPKMTANIKNCQPVLVLTDSRVMLLKRLDCMNPLSKTSNMWPTDIEFKTTDDLNATSSFSLPFLRMRSQNSLVFDEPNIEPEDLAFLQYTSGSTGR